MEEGSTTTILTPAACSSARMAFENVRTAAFEAA